MAHTHARQKASLASPHGPTRFRKAFLALWGPPYRAAEAPPESLPCVPARVKARVEAGRKPPRTCCRAGRGAAGNVDR
eukprot:3274131-Pyramimonas_sp.AAC.1